MGTVVYPVVDGEKQCKCCKRWLALDQYPIQKKRGTVYYRGACRACYSQISSRYHRAHREQYKASQRRYRERCKARDPLYRRRRSAREAWRKVMGE